MVIRTQISTLLGKAEQCAKKADTEIAVKRIDRAYVEYLTCSEILLNIIPRHGAYPDLHSSRKDLSLKYRTLRKVS